MLSGYARLAALAAGVCLFTQLASAQLWHFRGTVVMEDGLPPTRSVSIERYCMDSRSLRETVTDRKGRFSFIYQQVNSIDVLYAWGVLDCVLRAALPGYESTTIDLTSRKPTDDPNLPPIVLRRIKQEAQFNPNSPSGMPKPARKAWDRGTKAAASKNWSVAEGHIRAAVEAAPRFAAAWHMLGLVLANQNKFEEARESLRKAIDCDPKLLGPYMLLARVDYDGKNWEEMTKLTDALIKADTKRKFPDAYLYNAMGRYQLRDLDAAEASAHEAVRLNTNRQLPQSDYVLSLILAAKRDYAGAAASMRKYIDLNPKAAGAEGLRTWISKLGTPEAAEPPAESFMADLQPSGAAEMWAPGGMKALAAAANMGAEVSRDNFLAKYCQALVRYGTVSMNAGEPWYLDGLREYFVAMAELVQAGQRQTDRTVIKLSLLTQEDRKAAARILPLLGWKLVQPEANKIELGDRTADGLRQTMPAALGIDELEMQRALDEGRTFTFEIPSESVRLVGGDSWARLIAPNQPLVGGLAESFVRDWRFAKACAGLSAMESDTATAMIAGVGVRSLVLKHADLVALHPEAFAIKNGAVVIPGGPEAEPVWRKLAGTSPRNPPQFFRDLLEKDGGKLAEFYSALSRSDAAHQQFFTKTEARASRFYDWYRKSGEPGEFFQDLPLDPGGDILFPGGKNAWSKSAGESGEDVLLALRSPEPFLAAARLEEKRKTPLDEASAMLFARHYAEWRPLIPYFERIPGLGRAEFERLAKFADAIRAYPTGKRNLVLGEWHSLVELIGLGTGAGSLVPSAGAKAFGRACDIFEAGDFSAKALELVRAMAGGAPDVDEAVRTGLLRLTGARRAMFDRVMESQNVPRLEDVLESRDDAKTLVALSGLVYAAWLDPEGLLVSEDPVLLRKHQFAGADLFLPPRLEVSNNAVGSYFIGGFANFEEAVGKLAPGGAVAAPDMPPSQLSAPSGYVPLAPAGDVFRADARLVQAYATVTDGRGHYIDDLPAAEFSILDEGEPQPITAFEPQFSSVSCALLLDTTESMRAALPALKNAALKLIQDLRPADSVAIYSFNDKVSALQPFTLDKAVAKKAVLKTHAGRPTALYDALARVSRDISARSGKKIIVVFSDGSDNSSTLTAETAIRRAKMTGAAVYTVAQGAALASPVLVEQLANIATATGGLAFTIREPNEIRGVLEKIAEDMLHGYLFAFRPAAVESGEWRKIEVRLQNSKGYKVRAREGYYPQ